MITLVAWRAWCVTELLDLLLLQASSVTPGPTNEQARANQRGGSPGNGCDRTGKRSEVIVVSCHARPAMPRASCWRSLAAGSSNRAIDKEVQTSAAIGTPSESVDEMGCVCVARSEDPEAGATVRTCGGGWWNNQQTLKDGRDGRNCGSQVQPSWLAKRNTDSHTQRTHAAAEPHHAGLLDRCIVRTS